MWLCKWIQLSSPLTEYVVTSDNVCSFLVAILAAQSVCHGSGIGTKNGKTTSKITKEENDHVTETKQESKYLSSGNVRNHGIRVWSTIGAQLDNAHTGW